MTKKQVVSKFLAWAENRPGLKAEVEELGSRSGKCENRVFRLVEYTPSGAPWTTACFEVFPPGTKDVDGWYEVIRRKCAGKLTVDQFSEIGIGKCGSVEEFVLRLEVLG